MKHDAIDQLGGNVSAAARLLNVSRDYIRYRQKKSGKESDIKLT
ncbi:MAG: hypothetical protein CMO44_11905 [Verrucomicrobiales bacterium]|nr:hypothetical protein [Verrucomicrobiales bacterium]